MANLKNIDGKDRIIVALDCSREEALELARNLQGKAKWLKVGMTLYYKEGPQFVSELKALGYNVFVDLKVYDIPFQAAGAVRSLLASGADMFTVHASGASEMMSQVAQAVQEVSVNREEAPVSLGVTVLTSMTEKSLQEINIKETPANQVVCLAQLALNSGLSGVVASPQEAKELRSVLGEDAYIVTPGVRPAGASLDDQKRVATPFTAISSGASHIVVGRPITKAENPVEAFDAIVTEINSISDADWTW